MANHRLGRVTQEVQREVNDILKNVFVIHAFKM